MITQLYWADFATRKKKLGGKERQFRSLCIVVLLWKRIDIPAVLPSSHRKVSNPPSSSARRFTPLLSPCFFPRSASCGENGPHSINGSIFGYCQEVIKHTDQYVIAFVNSSTHPFIHTISHSIGRSPSSYYNVCSFRAVSETNQCRRATETI